MAQYTRQRGISIVVHSSFVWIIIQDKSLEMQLTKHNYKDEEDAGRCQECTPGKSTCENYHKFVAPLFLPHSTTLTTSATNTLQKSNTKHEWVSPGHLVLWRVKSSVPFEQSPILGSLGVSRLFGKHGVATLVLRLDKPAHWHIPHLYHFCVVMLPLVSSWYCTWMYVFSMAWLAI